MVTKYVCLYVDCENQDGDIPSHLNCSYAELKGN